MTNGTMTLNGVTDEQMSALFEAKAQHEGVLLFAPNFQPIGYQPPPMRPPYNPMMPVGPMNPRPGDPWPPIPGMPGYPVLPPDGQQIYNNVILSWNSDEGLKAVEAVVAILLQGTGQSPAQPNPNPPMR